MPAAEQPRTTLTTFLLQVPSLSEFDFAPGRTPKTNSNTTSLLILHSLSHPEAHSCYIDGHKFWEKIILYPVVGQVRNLVLVAGHVGVEEA